MWGGGGVDGQICRASDTFVPCVRGERRRGYVPVWCYVVCSTRGVMASASTGPRFDPPRARNVSIAIGRMEF